MVRDYPWFSADEFNSDLLQRKLIGMTLFQILLTILTDCFHSTFFNKVNRLVNKHAPLKTLSKRKSKELLKSWITKGIRNQLKSKIATFRRVKLISASYIYLGTKSQT